MYKFSSKANFGTQSGLWTVWCNAIENTYRLYVLTKMLLDIIDCWKLTSLIIALQMVGDLYLSAQLKLLCLVLAWKLKWITLSNIFVLSTLLHTRVSSPKIDSMKRHSVHLDFLIFRLSSSCCSIFGLSFPFPSSSSRLGSCVALACFTMLAQLPP